MAKMYARDGKLYIDYMVDGKRHRKSTKLDDTKENRTLIEKSIIPELERKIASGDIYKKKPKTFRSYYSAFLKRRENHSSYNLKKYQWDKVIEVFGDRDIDTITRFEVKEYLLNLPIQHNAKGSYRTLFREIFDMAIDDNVIANNHALNIVLPKTNKHNIEFFSKEEVRLLLSKAKGILRPYLLLAFNTGMRPEEILGLQIGDISDGMIDIKRVRTRGMIRHPKTRTSARKIPCPQFIIDEVVKIQGSHLFLFGKYDDVMTLYPRWRTLLKDCGLSGKLYSCRHTFATTMLLDGIVTINELSGLLGHSNVHITLTHYTSVIESKNIKLGHNLDIFGSNMTQQKEESLTSS